MRKGSGKYGDRRVLVCIPAYNEGKTIGGIIDKAKEISSEIIIYDDGSKDDTRKIAESAGAVVIGNKTNRGYGMAIRELFRVARKENVDIMVTLDSDGQHDPGQIPDLLRPILNDECDIVIGSRFLNKSDSIKVPRYRNLGIKAITRFTRAASFDDLTDAQSGFRAYNREAISKIFLFQNGMSVSTEILLRASENELRISEVPVTVKYDVERSSTSNPVSHGLGVLMSVVQYISLRRPLLFYGLPGLLLMLVATFFIYQAIEMFSSTRYVSTNIIIISIGLAVVGVILLATGAIVHTLVALFRGKFR